LERSMTHEGQQAAPESKAKLGQQPAKLGLGGEMVILGRSYLNEPPVPRDKTSIIDVKRAQDHYQTLRYTGDMISLKVIFSNGIYGSSAI
jgi:hypothetical protein